MTFTQTILRENGERVARYCRPNLADAPGPQTYLHQEAVAQHLVSGVYFVVETYSDQSFNFHRIQLTVSGTPIYTTHCL